MNIVNLYENYNNYFNADLKAIFERCSKIAHKHNYKLYLIGGIVRDLLLDKKNLDIDITVVGNAIDFCKILEIEKVGKIISEHKSFGTAKMEISGRKIDFASTRCESYPRKGHLPVVTEIGCPLKCDVERRDFTINSLAISLNNESFADLIDYVGGFNDLKSKNLRILHDKSFIDDPTRIIRGLKFAVRLGFKIEPHTLELQENYLKNINYYMSNKRVKSELKQTFNLNSQVAFEKFINEGIYKLITKKTYKLPKDNIENMITNYKPKHAWLVYLGIIGVCENDDFSDNLELTKSEKDIIMGAKSLLHSDFKNDFEIYKAFGAHKIETLLILALSGKKKPVFHYLDNLKKIKLHITGKDLLSIGIEPSKIFGEIFDYVLREKLKNPQLKHAEEIAFIKDYVAKKPL